MACSPWMRPLVHPVLTEFSSARHGQIQKLYRGPARVTGPTREPLLGRGGSPSQRIGDRLTAALTLGESEAEGSQGQARS